MNYRIEVAGPELPPISDHYGVGQARCSAVASGALVEKRYSTWAIGTVDSGVFSYTTPASPSRAATSDRMATAVPPGPHFASLYGKIRRLTRSETARDDDLVDLRAIALNFGPKARRWEFNARDLASVASASAGITSYAYSED